MQPPAVPHDQRSAVDPQDGRPDDVVGFPVNVGANAKISRRLVRVSASNNLLAFNMLNACDKQYGEKRNAKLKSHEIHGSSI
jgi:hypothetical protein